MVIKRSRWTCLHTLGCRASAMPDSESLHAGGHLTINALFDLSNTAMLEVLLLLLTSW